MALSRLHPSLCGVVVFAVPLLLSVVLACNQKTQEGHGLPPPRPPSHHIPNSSPAPSINHWAMQVLHGPCCTPPGPRISMSQRAT